MKITEIRVILTCPGQNYVLVKVLTDAGIYGVGDGTLCGSEPAVARAIEHAAPLLIGRDPLATEDAWQLIYHWSYWRGGPVFMAALSAFDLALWDIKGKVANLPVYQLLGGKARSRVACYGHAYGRNPQEVEESVRSFQEQGYRYVRAQLVGGYGGYGGPGVMRHEPSACAPIPGTDYFDPAPYLASTPRLFAHLRAALGDEVELLHDVHEQLTPIQAAWLSKRLEPYRLFYLEDALRPEQIDHFALLRAASTTALAMGELLTDRRECLTLFQNQWIDFIRIAPIHAGGITEARKISTLAGAYQVHTAFHGAADISPIGQAAAVHLAMAISNFAVQEWITFPEMVHEVMPGACMFDEGYTAPPERPGLGVDVDEERARAYPYQQAYMPIVRRVDGGMHVY